MAKKISSIFDLPDKLSVLRPQMKSSSQIKTLNVIIDKLRAGEFGPNSKIKEREIVLISQLALIEPYTNEIIDQIKTFGIE